MTGRERQNNILNSKFKDKLPWVTLVDDKTRSIMQPDIKEMPVMDFYRYIGSDIFQFGNYGLNKNLSIKYPYKLLRKDVQEEFYEDSKGFIHKKLSSQWGELTSVSRVHPVKFLVETLDDLKISKKIWLNSDFIECIEGCEETYRKVDELIGDSGIYVPTIGPSTMQQLLEEDMGVQNFYYMLADYPEEVNELIDIMHDKRKQQYKIVAEKMPYNACISVENTSTTLISPAFYRMYSLPHLKDFVDIMHANGKKAILHMCGLVKNLLYDIKETGLDGAHAITPPTVGDTEFHTALDILGEDIVIYGVLDGTVFHKPYFKKEELFTLLDRTITERLKHANFVLCVAVDGLPTEIERLTAVTEWIEKNARL